MAVLALLLCGSVAIGTLEAPFDDVWASFTSGCSQIWAALTDLRMPAVTRESLSLIHI